jgi:hypothetical protein
MQVTTEEMIINGRLIKSDVIHINNKEIIISGKFTKTACIKEEWDVDVDNPDFIIKALQKNNINADIFTFMQRLPYSRPKFDYYMEWDNVAAIPIKDYDTWYKKQLHENPRNKIKKAQKQGVVIKVSILDDKFIEGIKEIYNETPFRQGRPYWNYGMNFSLTKKENSQFLERAFFIGAFFNEELIGYIRLVQTDRYMRTMGILAKIAYRDKATMNLLLAKAVEICAEKKVPYLVYAKFDYGKIGSDSMMTFKYYNGFESIDLPRYYIPLTMRGKIILYLNLHHGLIGILPRKMIRILRSIKHSWYARKH